MIESSKEEPDRKEIDKKEEISIQEEILPSSTVEDACTDYKQEYDGCIRDKQWCKPIIYLSSMNIYLSLNKDQLLGALHRYYFNWLALY